MGRFDFFLTRLLCGWWTPSDTMKRICAVALSLTILGGGGLVLYGLYETGYQDGNQQAVDDAYQGGYQKGANDQKAKDKDDWTAKVVDARKDGYDSGYEEGQKAGYEDGKEEGRQGAYDDGYSEGYTDGYDQGNEDGYDSGYTDGYADGKASVKIVRKPASNSVRTVSQTVYVTATGSKYHRSGCSYLRQSCYSISLDDAKARGYTACSRCW